MDETKWRNWKIDPPRAEDWEGDFSVIIKAPSAGVAIEFYIGTHGYDSAQGSLLCVPTNEPLYGSREHVEQVLGTIDSAVIERLDIRHLSPDNGFVVAASALEAFEGKFTHGPFRTHRAALDVRPKHPGAVLCEVGQRTIIKAYWMNDQWIYGGDIEIIGSKGDNGNLKYAVPGAFEIDGVPLFSFMRAFDSIVDNGGEGRSLSICVCASCGQPMALPLATYVPINCDTCQGKIKGRLLGGVSLKGKKRKAITL